MKAMLLAAGLGTRLKPFTDRHPKALAEVGGRTLLEINLRYLQSFGIGDVIVNVHHFADQIEQVIWDAGGFGSRVTVSDERAAVLETGGGVQHALPLMESEEEVLVMNTDVLTDLKLDEFIKAFRQSGGSAMLAVMQRPSSRQLLFDPAMQLTGWRNNGTGEERFKSGGSAPGAPFAFSGIQLLKTEFIRSWAQTGKFSLIDAYLGAGPEQRLTGYDHTGGLFLDVGKPEALAKANLIRRELD